MLPAIEMQGRVKRDSNIVRFVSVGDQSNASIREFYVNIAQAVRDGQIAFFDAIIIESNRKRIMQKEKETYECHLKLKLAELEHQLIIDQTDTITDYVDTISEGGDVKSLKQQLNDKLKNLIYVAIDNAIELELKVQSEIKERFIFLECQELDKLSLKVFYLKYFDQHILPLPLTAISAAMLNLAFKISHHNTLDEKINYDYNKLCDELHELHIYHEKRKEESKSKLKNLLININTRGLIPLPFQYDPSDEHSISRLVDLHISPDFIDPNSGDTLLHIAINSQKADILRLLLERGADPFVTNQSGIPAHTTASLHCNPKYLKIMTKFTEAKPLRDIHTKDTPTELVDIINPVLEQAKKLLDQYGIILKKRKGLSLFLRILLQYEDCIDSRSLDYATYSEKLRIADHNFDPHIFFNEVLKRASIAKKGALNSSSLHDPLVSLMQKFLRDFDAYSYNELRKSKEFNARENRPNISPKEDMIKILQEQLNAANNEIKILRARIKREEKENPSEPTQGARPKQSFF